MHLTIFLFPLFSGFQKNLPASVLPKVDNLRRSRTEKRICLNKRNLFQNWKMMKTTVLKILYITSVESWCRFHIQNIWVPRTIFFQYDNIRPKVISCIRIDSNLRTQLFYETSLVPFQNGSRMITILEILKINQRWNIIMKAFLWITRLLLRLMRFI